MFHHCINGPVTSRSPVFVFFSEVVCFAFTFFSEDVFNDPHVDLDLDLDLTIAPDRPGQN